MTAPGATEAFGPSDIIDFRLERSRHEHFFGREDVFAELDRLVEKKQAGFVLVLGGPGMGKSALLSRWLDRREERGEPTPHHFLRRGVNRWDELDVVRSNLASRLEALYPAQRDKDAPPERRLEELLVRVSQQALAPEKKRLVLVLDGLDEAASRDEHDNPVARLLPYRLPKGVVVVCASRPMYPHLAWLEQREQMVHPPLDLAQPAWVTSNLEAVAAYWAFAREQFSPPLSQALVSAAVQGAQGNLLYSIKLSEWLESLSVEERQGPGIAARLPRGLEALLEGLWGQLQASPGEAGAYVRQGLGLLAVAREALPARCIEAALGWDHGTADARLLRTAARQAVIEEPAEWHGKREPRYHLYHDSFGELVRAKMAGELPALHRRLAEQVAAWPPAHVGDAFLRGYALRHGIAHRAEAARDEADWRALEHLCLNVSYLRDAATEAGPLALEVTLEQAAERCPVEPVSRTLFSLCRALMKESHWLRHGPHALPELLWNQLLNRGWPPERLRGEAQWPSSGHSYRLYCPLQHVDRSLRVVPTEELVSVCAPLPDGRRIVYGSRDGTLRVLDLETGRELLRFEGHREAVLCCTMLSDGRRLVSGSSDRTLRVWDLESGRELMQLQGHGWIQCCAVLPDGRLVAGSGDCTLRVWDLASGRELMQLQGHKGTVLCCAVLPDGRLVSGSGDHTLRVWDLETGRELLRLEGHEGWVHCCVVLPDGRLVSGSGDNTLRVWDLAEGRELLRLEGHEQLIHCCALLPDGRRLVSGSYDRTLRVWDLASGRELLRLEGHEGWVQCCAVLPDGRRLVSGSHDRTFRLWDLEGGYNLVRPQGYENSVLCCAVLPDGRLVAGSGDGTLQVWDLASGRELMQLQGHKGPVLCCALLPDGRRLVSGSGDGTLRVWDLDCGVELVRLQGHDWIQCCAVLPDGRLVAGSRDGTLQVWDPASGRELVRLQGHKGSVLCCAVLPDGRLVAGSHDKTVRVWDLASGRELLRLEGHEGWVQCCAVLPDGRRLVSGSRDGTLRLWDLASGRELLRLEGHEGWVQCCAVLPDGRRLVSGSRDGTLRIWDLETGRLETVVYGAHSFLSVAASKEAVVAGDGAGNVWFLTNQPFNPAPRSEPTSPPRLSQETSAMRFLHLTDWHVGMAEQGWLWPNVREAFFDDLARLHARVGGFDAVFFTGDLTQRGSVDEFAKLDEGLGAIWQRLTKLGSDPVLVAVPGNHDLQRPPPKGAVVKALGTWQADEDVRDALWSEPEGDYRQCVRTAFSPYAAWAERHPAMKRAHPRWGALPGDIAAVVERGGLRVGVVGLNSAFLQLTGADYDQRLDLDVRQLHAACGSDAPAWLAQNDVNLLLTHHPPSWLAPERKKHFETEIAPPGRFALHLHGHLHDPNAYAEAVGGSRPRHRLAGPSLFGLERFGGAEGVREERIHGYTAGRLELVAGEGTAAGKAVAKVQLWPRHLVTKKSGARVMERDGAFELDDDESFVFEVPCKGRVGGP
jgi:WD40 repeat protein/calcineurin-like phosphoesterase family protein